MKSIQIKVSQDNEKKDNAKHKLDKYMFFFDRYQNHNLVGEHAKDLVIKIGHVIKRLVEEKHYPVAELEFLREALVEVVRCRKVLKGTYTYEFYLEDENKKALF